MIANLVFAYLMNASVNDLKYTYDYTGGSKIKLSSPITRAQEELVEQLKAMTEETQKARIQVKVFSETTNATPRVAYLSNHTDSGVWFPIGGGNFVWREFK